LHARKENSERSSRGQNGNIHIKADNFNMVPLPPEVKRIARLEHVRRHAERRFADRMKLNFCAFASEAVNARRSRRAAAHPAN
jgi:hypothetical protein